MWRAWRRRVTAWAVRSTDFLKAHQAPLIGAGLEGDEPNIVKLTSLRSLQGLPKSGACKHGYLT